MKTLDLVFAAKNTDKPGAKAHWKLKDVDENLAPAAVEQAMRDLASFDFLVDAKACNALVTQSGQPMS
ncbi:hypothetical protein [Weissella cibaria]|uniref:DUF2922 domain-containing protein n=1 Tax=Weissella cibaria TaxID=137591 RepID=A0A0D1KCT9_9LACO|nr:hypothetical protein [Weissella cibaria]KIU22724.1 hypothetical protein QX99_00233 [Weissella cibaria]KIU24042.1 hypothetical protein ff3pr_00437 [Weissella cibaria]MDV8929176.1 hypothetical protein [Weissella cibaria]